MKRALDESAQEINSKPSKESIERMQEVISTWQSQAHSAQTELGKVLNHAEELKTINSNLSSKIADLDATNKQMQDELRERTQESTELMNNLTKLHHKVEQLDQVNMDVKRESQLASTKLTSKEQDIIDLKDRIQQLELKNDKLNL